MWTRGSSSLVENIDIIKKDICKSRIIQNYFPVWIINFSGKDIYIKLKVHKNYSSKFQIPMLIHDIPHSRPFLQTSC